MKGTSYEKSLNEVIRIRKQRKKVYGDSWQDLRDWELLAFIKMKVSRLENFIIDKKKGQFEESIKDTLIDLTNYSLFLLENKRREGVKNDKR